MNASASTFDRKFALNYQRPSAMRWLQMFAISVLSFGFIGLQGIITDKSKSLRATDYSLPASNRFSHSDINSPYEQIFVGTRLPKYQMKLSPEAQQIEKTIAPKDRICFVHVGKAGGSSVGCALGFGLHCPNNTVMMDGILPRRTTNTFHSDGYDCYDESEYFLFVVRSPLERIKSAFLYERPYSETHLQMNFPKYYKNRKAFYMDCPFRYLEDWVRMGLMGMSASFGSNIAASEECQKIAHSSVWGTGRYVEHMFFNYQFHLEGIPSDAKILVIRNEHLVDDWNQVEHHIGGEKNILTKEMAETRLPVINKKNNTNDPSVKLDRYPTPKYMSEEATNVLCRNLCNEIVTYKKILRRSANLNYQQIEESISELRESCGKYADYNEGDCYVDMPDIEDKLIAFRGYTDQVPQAAVTQHKDRLEDPNPPPPPKKSRLGEEVVPTDDDARYPLF